MARHELVLVESPLAGPTAEIRERNLAYARAALRDCLLRGEIPFAGHLLYTQPGVLNDEDPTEREIGLCAGLALGQLAVRSVIYRDLGISPGMLRGIDSALECRRVLEFRNLEGWKP